MTDAEKIENLQNQITALKAISAAVIGALANRDRALAIEIVSALTILRRGGNGSNVVALSPDLEAVQRTIDDFLHELRDFLGSE